MGAKQSKECSIQLIRPYQVSGISFTGVTFLQLSKKPHHGPTPPTQHPHTCESSRYLKEIHLLDKQKVSFYMETRGFNTKRSVLHKCSNSGKYGNVDMLGKKALRFLSCLNVLVGGEKVLPLPSGFWNAAEEPMSEKDGHRGAAGSLHTVRGQ